MVSSTESSQPSGLLIFDPDTGDELAPRAEPAPKKIGHVRYDQGGEWSADALGKLYCTNLDSKYGDWRAVPGFPANVLLVSSMGWVILKSSGRGSQWAKPAMGWVQKGYFWIQLHWHSYAVGRLICRAFNGPPPEGRERVLYAVDNKFDNKAETLRWGTRSEARKGNLTAESVGNLAFPVTIRHADWDVEKPNVAFNDYKSAARFFGVCTGTIAKAVQTLAEEECKQGYINKSGKLQGWRIERMAGDNDVIKVDKPTSSSATGTKRRRSELDGIKREWGETEWLFKSVAVE
jgi:hypothetical protein